MSHHVSIELFTRREYLGETLLALLDCSDCRREGALLDQFSFEREVSGRDYELYSVPIALPLDDVLNEWVESQYQVWPEEDPMPEEAGYEVDGVFHVIVAFDLWVRLGSEYAHLSLGTVSKFDNEILYSSPSARACLLDVFRRSGGDLLMLFDGVEGYEDFEEGPPPRHNFHPGYEGDTWPPWEDEDSEREVEKHRRWLLALRERLRAGEGAPSPEVLKQSQPEEPEPPIELVPIRSLTVEELEPMRHLTGRLRPHHPEEEFEWYATEDASVLGLVRRRDQWNNYTVDAYITGPERLNIYLNICDSAGSIKTLKKAREEVHRLMSGLASGFQPASWFRPGDEGYEHAKAVAEEANTKARARRDGAS